MHTIYNLVSGPLVWAALIIFIGGTLYRLASLGIIARKKDVYIYAYASPYFGLRSIFRWLIPFGTVNMRKRPVLTVVSFIFHICVLSLPIFVLGHISLINESWHVRWPHLPDSVADVMTVIVIASCIFFLVRRKVMPEVKFLTSASDYFILAMVAAPFITGFWAYHQFAGYQIATILHMLSGEIMLAAIPFTRLSHMIFYPFTRGYIGSEFGAVRHARDW
jgi:nitrate reductase gamma subunit